MSHAPFLTVQNLSYSYSERQALKDFSLELNQGEIFGLLGPNGGGKSTLFKLLTTLRPLQLGDIQLDGLCYRCSPRELRSLIGTVFQSPALDKKLSVYENLWHQGKLFNLPSPILKKRIDLLTERFGIKDRLRDSAEKLSGGLQRRVEIAKALLHEPKLLIMDEPSTGLDPGIRLELWDYLQEIRRSDGITILLTTHLLDEAERCDRIAIIHEGHLITEGKPLALCEALGGQVLSVTTENTSDILDLIKTELGTTPKIYGNEVRLRLTSDFDKMKTSTLAARLADHPQVQAVTLSRPSLSDLYLEKTGKSWTQH